MRKQILKRVLGFSRPYIGYLVLALISAVLSVGMTLYAPILIGRGIDQIIGPGNVDFKAILSDIAWLAGTVAVGALFQWLLAQCTNILAYRTDVYKRQALYGFANGHFSNWLCLDAV